MKPSQAFASVEAIKMTAPNSVATDVFNTVQPSPIQAKNTSLKKQLFAMDRSSADSIDNDYHLPNGSLPAHPT